MPVTTANGKVAGGVGVGEGDAVGDGVWVGAAGVEAAGVGVAVASVHAVNNATTHTTMAARRFVRVFTPLS
jgi:hypothetical protein